MWTDISDIWKKAFREAWTSFRNGCTPIGAVLTDESGNIILSDHNRCNESDIINRKISHAEANMLRRLDTTKYEAKKLTLYSTMEPCPMCLGIAVMSNIRQLQYAARDPYCGFVHIRDYDSYIEKRSENYQFIDSEMEYVQLVIQSYYELRYIELGASDNVLNAFNKLNNSAVRIAKSLFESKVLDAFVEENLEFGNVYDYIIGLK